MSRKRVLSIVSLLVILSMMPLLVGGQTNRRRQPNRANRANRAIGAGGAGTYVKRSKPRRLINVEALPAKTRRKARTTRR